MRSGNGVSDDFLYGGTYELEVVDERVPCTIRRGPLYDPEMKRVKELMGQVRKVPDNLAWRAGAEVHAVNGGETKLVIPEFAMYGPTAPIMR